MNTKMYNDLKAKGFEYIEFKKDDYPVWELWDSPDTIFIDGIMYKDLVEDFIYFFCTNYKKEAGKALEYEDAVLSVDIHENESEAQIEEDVEIASKLQEKIKNGYEVKPRDILGKFVGAETSYYFEDEGNFRNTLKCDDIVEYLNEKHNLIK